MDTSELLKRGVSEVIDKDNLEKRLQSHNQLRVKLGIDPTTPQLHLGHLVPLRKLRQFQTAGHQAVLIIGDYTALIGDPSGRQKTRPPLTKSQVKENLKTFKEQAFRILDPSKTEVVFQSGWYAKFDLEKLIELASKVSVWHLLSHETFVERKKKGQALMTHELIYPFLQGYDSVAIKADIELGGIDQKFNLLTGRIVQQAYGQKPQDVVMMPYLAGTDGKQKMSKSLGNTINLDDLPQEIYGKVMSIPDELVMPYFELVTDLEFKALEKVDEELKSHPRDAKAHLAFLVVEEIYDRQDAEQAKYAFDRVFRERRIPEHIEAVSVGQKTASLVDLLVVAKLASSRSQAVILVKQGGVKVDQLKVTDPAKQINVNNNLIQVGKRRFARLSYHGAKK